MFGYIYGNGEGENKQEIITDNEIFIMDNSEVADEVDTETETDLKNKYFKCWKDSVESEKKDRNDRCSFMNCEFGVCQYVQKENSEEDGNDDDEDECIEGDDKLNYNDSDETDCENKVYIISLNGIPYFYDDNLQKIRNTMWDIANNMLKNNRENNSASSNYILTNNSNEVKIVSPYNFFWFFNYNHTISQLKIDYVIKFPTKQEKQD